MNLILIFCFIMLAEISIASRLEVSQVEAKAEANRLERRMRTTISAALASSLAHLFMLGARDIKPEFVQTILVLTISSYILAFIGAGLFIIAGIEMCSSMDDRITKQTGE